MNNDKIFILNTSEDWFPENTLTDYYATNFHEMCMIIKKYYSNENCKVSKFGINWE